MAKVCLDAGHYGKYNRSPVLTSYYESDMTWKLHNYLASELEEYGISVIKTRTSQNVDRELVSRGAASKGCDLFISLHSNASSNASASYAIAYCLSEKSGVTYDDKSREFGKLLTKTVGEVMGCEGRVGTRAAGDWDRDGNGKYDDEYYGVLQGAKQAGTPGVIMEHGFHTNLAQTQWLSNDNNLKKLAKAEAECIAKYLNVSKPTPTPAPTQYPAVPFLVEVKISDLNIRTEASMNGKVVGQTGKAIFTITKVSDDWGFLKSGAGWIYLANPSYTTIKDTVRTVADAKSKDAALSGKYAVTADALNLRWSPGTGDIIIAMPKNTLVFNYGYYTTNGGVKWLLVETTISGKKYTGYCSSYYLKKQ